MTLRDGDPRAFRIIWQYYAGVWAEAALLFMVFVFGLESEELIKAGDGWRAFIPDLLTGLVFLVCIFVIKWTRDYVETFR